MHPPIHFTPQQLERLQNQSFNDFAPGTLLKDFGAFLDFIGTEGIEVSKVNQLFAGRYLAELNALLTKPMTLHLKQPVQKSYPYVNGLYLLLRSSGLAYVEMGKKQSRLMLNAEVLASWKALNAVERYFALFDAWWRRGSNELFGERDSYRMPDNFFYPCIDFFKHTLGKQASKDIDKSALENLRYFPGLHNLALLELFGLIEIHLDEQRCEASWPIVKLEVTTWGTVLLQSLADSLSEFNPFDGQDEAQPITPLLDTLKSIRQDLRNTLVSPEQQLLDDASVTIKVTLEKSSRTLVISSAVTLDELANAILKAFAFDNDHLYEFSYKNVFGMAQRIVHPEAAFEEGDALTSAYSLGELPLRVGMSLTFLFDFGDYWEFLLVIEAIDTEGKPPAKAKIIQQKGEPPKQYSWDDYD